MPTAKAVANAIMSGEITAHEGQAFSKALEAQICAINSTETERRLAELEAQQAESHELNGFPRFQPPRHREKHRKIDDLLPDGFSTVY